MIRIGGIVLCGGHSKRMGQSKAWLPFGKERMLQRVVRILGAVVQPVIVVAAPNQDLPGLSTTVSVVARRHARPWAVGRIGHRVGRTQRRVRCRVFIKLRCAIFAIGFRDADG